MLQARRSRRKLQRSLIVLVASQTVDQSRGERIAGANTIDDVGDWIMPAARKSLPAVHHRRPPVPVRALTLAKRDRLALEIRKSLQHLVRQRSIFVHLQCT